MANYEYCKALQDRGNVFKASEIPFEATTEERYISMFGFDNSIYEHLELSKAWNKDHNGKPKQTVSQFKGNYYCRMLYFDIDSDDLKAALEMARNLTILLHNILSVNPKMLVIAFSGNKGFHIGIPAILFGGMEPRKDLPAKVRTLAIKLLCECFEVSLEQMERDMDTSNKKQVYNLIDLSIYNDNRIFRALNSMNHKGKRYKVGLTYEQLHSMSMSDIIEYASVPHLYKPEIPASQMQPVSELVRLWQETLTFNELEYHQSTRRTSAPATDGGSSIFYLPSSGGRNDAYFKQAAHLFDNSQLTKNQVFQLLKCVNMACVPPLPESELYTTVNSAYKRTANNTKETALQQATKPVKEIEVFNDWIDEWAEYYTTEPKQLTYLHPQIDHDQEFNYSGKLACFIGQGGTKKSYYALNIVAENVIFHEARVMYSSMEMGKVEMVNRLLDMAFDPENNIAASKIGRRKLKENDTEYISTLKKAISAIDDCLILSNVSNRTTEEYYKDWQKTTELYGPVDFLVVDGLSMMGGKGSETERFEHHTKELKGFANATGVNVILICHTTKEAKQYTRDCTTYARGSGKIFDNCDFTISFSNLIDDISSTPESIEYVPCMGHLRYYNKRGTGLTINSCYDFHGVTKKVTASARDPRHFPEFEAFVKQYNAKHKAKQNATESEPF